MRLPLITVRPNLIALLMAAGVAAAALAPQPAIAQYKWKDASGATVYSDQPPPTSAKEFQVMRTGTVHGSASGSRQPAEPGTAAAPEAPAGGDFRAQEAAFQKRRADQMAATKKAGEEQAAAAAKKAGCNSARENLALLESGARMGYINEQGERAPMTDEVREARIAAARKLASENCSN